MERLILAYANMRAEDAVKDILNFARLISDDNRLKIIRLLSDRDMCVCELMEIMQVPQSRISQHLLRLRSEGIVSDRRESQWVIYALNKEILEQRLERLEMFMRGPASELDCMKDEFDRLNHIENRGLLSEKLTKGCRKNPQSKKTSNNSKKTMPRLRTSGSVGKEARV